VEGSVVGLEGRGWVRVGGAAHVRGMHTVAFLTDTCLVQFPFPCLLRQTRRALMHTFTSFLSRSCSPTHSCHSLTLTHPLTPPCRWAARAW
jgi:hypothetical protein